MTDETIECRAKGGHHYDVLGMCVRCGAEENALERHYRMSYDITMQKWCLALRALATIRDMPASGRDAANMKAVAIKALA